MEFFKKLKNGITAAFYAVCTFVAKHKIVSATMLSIVAAGTVVAIIVSCVLSAPADAMISNSNSKYNVLSEPEITAVSEEPISTEEPTTSSEPAKPMVEPKPESKPVAEVVPQQPAAAQYNYNSNMSPDSNVFLDALEYTGYKLSVQRNSGRMWGSYGNYVLCGQKRGLGWLSNITYGGGSTGYEQTVDGKPDIHRFEKGGLVCATYVTYVYFNYLPYVAGIDTSSLIRPERSYDANSWYTAAKQWVNAGYSRYIEFNANDGGSITRDIDFDPFEEIPIGSLMCTQDWYNLNGHCTHISIYAGTVNGYHWVTHVGNENGPEFCAMERMNRKPHPQWPLAIITTPSNIRFLAAVEVSVKDENGAPVQNAEISIKNIKSGVVTDIGSTGENGKVLKENLTYGEYQITLTVPDGYTCDNNTLNANFTTQNNSLNTAEFNIKKEVVEPDPEPDNGTSSATDTDAEIDKNRS